MRARIAMANNDSYLVRFSNFSEDITQTNCGVPLRIDRPAKWNSRHMTSFAAETGRHSLRSDFSTNNFRWIWFGCKDPHGGLLLCFGLIRIDPRFVTYDDLIHAFEAPRSYLSKVCLHQSARAIFKRLSNGTGSNENKSFLRPGCHAICADRRNYQGCLYLTVCHMPILHYPFTTSMISDTTAVFGRPSRTSSLRERRPKLNSLNQFSQCYGMVLYRQTKI